MKRKKVFVAYVLASMMVLAALPATALAREEIGEVPEEYFSAAVSFYAPVATDDFAPVSEDEEERLLVYGEEIVPLSTDIDITADFECSRFLGAVRQIIGIPAARPVLLSYVDSIQSLNVWGRYITSLAGVEHFTALEWLDVGLNQLTELDVSNNIALERLTVIWNQLTELDVSNNTALSWLFVGENQLTELDVSNNTALTMLSVIENQLTELDVSNNTALQALQVRENQLTELDVSNNTALLTLQVDGNQLTELDVSNNTLLQSFSVGWNQLTELDVSNNSALVWLYVEENQLTELDVSNNTALQSLGAWENQLTELDVSNNAALEMLSVQYNNMTSPDDVIGWELWFDFPGSDFYWDSPFTFYPQRGQNPCPDCGTIPCTCLPFPGVVWRLDITPELVDALNAGQGIDPVSSSVNADNVASFAIVDGALRVYNRTRNWNAIDIELGEILSTGTMYRITALGAGDDHPLTFRFPLDDFPWDTGNHGTPITGGVQYDFSLPLGTDYIPVGSSITPLRIRVMSAAYYGPGLADDFTLRSVVITRLDGDVIPDISGVSIYGAANVYPGGSRTLIADLTGQLNITAAMLASLSFEWQASATIGGVTHTVVPGDANPYLAVTGIGTVFVSNDVPYNTVVTVTATIDATWYPTVGTAAQRTGTTTFTVVSAPQPPPLGDSLLTVTTAFAEPGDTVAVQIRLDNNPGFAAMVMRLNFSPYLTLLDYELGCPVFNYEIPVPAELFYGFDGPLGNASFMGWFGRDSHVYTSGRLLTLHFEVDDGAQNGAFLPVGVVFENFIGGYEPPFDLDGNPLDIAIVNGGVNIRPVIFGDASASGTVSIADSTLLARYLAGHNVIIDRRAMDLNGDGHVDGLDMYYFRRWLLGRGLPPVLLP